MSSMNGSFSVRRSVGMQVWPHQYHLVLFLWFGLIALAGTLYSLFYRTHVFNLQYSAIRALDYTSAKAMQSRVPSMFADRRNWINVYFVKRAWFWNTLDMALIALTLDRTSGGLRGDTKRDSNGQANISYSQSVGLRTFFRWLQCTIGWVYVAVY
ncbi:hypothetical protein MYAM1_003002 [Malassezia yamatoensis]|uniref:Uncharacterized protein n=1 Tax=Malassezia yamatoensis TaxID=253288 RepID=A0AAJ5YVW8_9BASI|nr:hypothetical protein MYAM1_003002 [Malassezia yamatoensis]